MNVLLAVMISQALVAASLSPFVGTPRISPEFIKVNGFWLPGRVRSVTSTFLLGPTELDILFLNYQLHQGTASARRFEK